MRAPCVHFACAQLPWRFFYGRIGDFLIYARFARLRGQYRRGDASKNRSSLYRRSSFIFGRRFISGRSIFGNAFLLLRQKIRLSIRSFRHNDSRLYFIRRFIRLSFRLRLPASFIAFKFSARNSCVRKSRERQRNGKRAKTASLKSRKTTFLNRFNKRAYRQFSRKNQSPKTRARFSSPTLSSNAFARTNRPVSGFAAFGRRSWEAFAATAGRGRFPQAKILTCKRRDAPPSLPASRFPIFAKTPKPPNRRRIRKLDGGLGAGRRFERRPTCAPCVKRPFARLN